MASSGKIDELKKKFDENPRRYFAPLASEYRKVGDFEQAIAICREHLPKQPGHMSGHIVYGQALFDAHEFEEAKTVFETALTLDPENLIALRHLGDIALQVGDAAAARGWYQRGLDADPRNEEMAALLASAAGTAPSSFAPPQASPGPEASTPPVVAPAEPPAEAAATELPVTDEVKRPSPPSAPAIAADAAPEQAAPSAQFQWPTAMDETPTLVMETAQRPSPTESVNAATSNPDELLDLEDLSLGQPSAPPADAPSSGPRSVFGVELDRPGETGLTPAAFPRSTPPPAPLPEFSLDFDTAPSEAPTPADPFATETMAELYLSQGHYVDALRVYEELLEQRPGEPALEAQIARIRQLMAPTPVVPMPAIPATVDVSTAITEEFVPPRASEPGKREQEVPDLDASSFASAPEPATPVTTIREFLATLANRLPHRSGEAAPSEQPEQDLAVVAVSEQASVMAAVTSEPGREEPSLIEPTPPRPSGSVDALFHGAAAPEQDVAAAHALANAFTEAEEAPPEPIAGAPARRASQELSLDTVFREDVPQAPAPAASFSFDQFFAAPTPAAGTQAINPTPGSSTPATAEDIEQFNSWLQGLKKR